MTHHKWKKGVCQKCGLSGGFPKIEHAICYETDNPMEALARAITQEGSLTLHASRWGRYDWREILGGPATNEQMILGEHDKAIVFENIEGANFECYGIFVWTEHKVHYITQRAVECREAPRNPNSGALVTLTGGGTCRLMTT